MVANNWLVFVYDHSETRFSLSLQMQQMSHCLSVFTARRYASAVYDVVMCPSFRLSQAGRLLYRNDWTNRASFGKEASLVFYIDVKTFVGFFYFSHVFTFLTFFYFPNVFYFKKRWQSSERQAD